LSYENIKIVLVGTTHPGNIGGVARAMKNMCLSDLVLVSPEAEFPSGKARARASNALDILDKTRVVEELGEAIADCQLVVGASARLRAIPWPLVDARDCAQQLVKHSAQGRVALVFGREHSGLTNEELERCNLLVHIPANPDYSSLNIAAAVQVLSYEIHMAMREQAGETLHVSNDYPMSTAEEMEGLYQHFEQALETIGFFNPDNPRQLMRRLRRLFNRAQLDKMEMNILRGILAAAESPKKKN
jgi:tRNA (cytidine32/uridine32-2'-O)-methyltransferase